MSTLQLWRYARRHLMLTRDLDSVGASYTVELVTAKPRTHGSYGCAQNPHHAQDPHCHGVDLSDTRCPTLDMEGGGYGRRHVGTLLAYAAALPTVK